MRINVYSQELLLDAGGVTLVEQQADNGVVYSGIRLFQHSSNRLHDTPEDDDRSAVTFWLPRSIIKREALAEVFTRMALLARLAQPETGLDN